MILRFFTHRGDTFAPVGVKFGMDEWTCGVDLWSIPLRGPRANFTTIGAGMEYETPKLTIFSKFFKIL